MNRRDGHGSPRQRGVASALTFTLFVVGVTGCVLVGPSGQQTSGSDLSLMAARSTTVGSHSDSTASVRVARRVSGTGDDTVTAYVADVVLKDPTALKAVFAGRAFGEKTALPSTMAESVDALLAINGDYYSFRDEGIVVRNGTLYREAGAREGLAIYRDGTMKLVDETKTTGDQLVADQAYQVLSFGPGLVEDGVRRTGLNDYELSDTLNDGTTTTIKGQHARTGIGMVEKNHLVMIVVDGRDPGYSRGATLSEFAQMFVDAGATVAYNLDGGGSATMYFKGKVINKPRNGSKDLTERKCSDMLYLGDAAPGNGTTDPEVTASPAFTG